MAYITLNRTKLTHNYEFLDRMFRRHRIEWAVVVKLLCGNELYLREVLQLNPRQLCDARISNLKVVKKLSPDTETVYIRPAPLRNIAAVVRYADISFNTQVRTLKKLSEEAVQQGKIHKVVVVVELGERREGVMRSQIVDFYEKVRVLPNLRIVGLGANFACLSGVLPNRAKLRQLVLYRDLIVRKTGDLLPVVSGGSSVVIPLLQRKAVPSQVNHFRVGETLFFGTNAYPGEVIPGMYGDVLMLHAQIIELIRKPMLPDGELGANLEGYTPEFNPEDGAETAWRAIVDVGLLDVESDHLSPVDPQMQCIGASSDMLVVNLGTNPGGYKTGDHIAFKLDYMGVLRLMNSRYIEKRVIVPDAECPICANRISD